MNKTKFIAIVTCAVFWAVPALGATTGPVVGNHTFTGETTVAISSADLSGTHAVTVTTGQNVTSTAPQGTTITLQNDPANVNQGNSGIYANGGSVALGSARVVTVGPFGSGLNAYNGGSIVIGDNASISGDIKTAISVYGSGSSVTVGDSADLHGHIWGSGATVYAQGNGAAINIGDGAQIYNTPETGTPNTTTHRAVYASGGGAITIGDDALISTEGGGSTSYGVLAGDMIPGGSSGTVTLGDRVTVRTDGYNANAALAYGSGARIVFGEQANLSTAGERAYGILAGEGGRVDVGANSTIATTNTVYTSPYTSAQTHAIAAQDAGSVVNVGSGTTISTKGSNSLGAYARSGSTINLSDDISISTEGLAAYGVQVESGSTVTIGDRFNFASSGDRGRGINIAATGGTVTLGDDATFFMEGANGHGIYALGNAAVTAGDNLYIHMLGNDAWGLTAGNGAVVTVGDNSRIFASGDVAMGAYTSAGTLTIGESADIRTSGSQADAVYASNGGVLSVGGGSTVGTTGYRSSAIYAYGGGAKITTGDGVTITATGEGSYGVRANAGTEVALGAQNKISTEGDEANALVANGADAKISVGAGAEIRATGASADAVFALHGGRIDMAGAKIEAHGAGAAAIYALGSADAQSQVSGSGVFDIDGGVIAGDYSHIDLAMQDGSAFIGYTALGDTNAALDLAITGANSAWTMTQESAATSLALGGGAQVDFFVLPLGSVLRVGHLSASDTAGGIFKMKADLVAGSGDQLVAATSAGSHQLNVANSGSAETTGDETLTVVQTGDGAAEFALTGEVAAGAWLYNLRRTEADANNWELYSTGESSPTADAAVNTFAGAYLLSYAETQTLMQRLGDLRDTPYTAGAWFRVFGGKFESNGSSFVRGFDMDYGGVQLGYDRKIENNWKGRTYVGGYFGYSKGDLDYNTRYGVTGGSGNVDAKTLGAYAAYVQDDGFYADAVVKYMWMENDFSVLDTDGERVTGNGVDSGGVGFSLELGKRFRMAQNAGGGNWYIEPQVQYSYTHQDGGHYYASNGMKIGVDSLTSSLARVGVLVGYETPKTNFYAKASFVKEFDGDVNILANSVEIDESFGDSWWVYGVGFTSRLGERSSVYMSLERSEGGKFEEPWKIYGGWRIAF